jgi:hypothetical protein
MLLIIALVLVFIAVLLAARLRTPSRLDASNLGSMSEHWIAEYRASHSI